MKILVALFVAMRVALLELAGAALVVAGVWQFSPRAGWIAVGVAVLAKSYDLDTRDGPQR